jgi:hypothetical protein
LIKKEQCTLRLIHQFSARFTFPCRLPFLSFVERANFSLTRKLIWRLFLSVFISLDGILLRRLQSRFFSSRFNACTQGERGRERGFWREAEKKVNDGAQKKPEEFLPRKATLVLSQQGIISLLTSAEKNRRLPRKKNHFNTCTLYLVPQLLFCCVFCSFRGEASRHTLFRARPHAARLIWKSAHETQEGGGQEASSRRRVFAE